MYFNLPSLHQVVNSRRDSDAGLYWCEAKNELGVSRSRNATLQIAGELYNMYIGLSLFYVESRMNVLE